MAHDLESVVPPGRGRDNALWSRAQRLGSPRALGSDLRASHDVSQYSGHWQGSGEPCRKVIVACGDRFGWAGSVFSLRAAIKEYHENYTEVLRASEARLKFEDLAPAFDDRPGGAPVPEPASTRTMQAQTRFVKLEVKRMRGFDFALGDPGPDDADLYANARLRGQRFASTVIHDHDRFNFGPPYAPFTWIRSVPVGARASLPIRSITVRVRTGDRRSAGTDDDVYMRLANGLRLSLEKRAYNDFERDDDDTYAVPLDSLTRDGLSLKDIAYAQIEKSRDGAGGGWFLRSFEVRVNGNVIASPTVNKWLEGNRRTFRANVARDHRTSDIVPVWLDLDEDDYLFGGDDNGDINGNDRNTDIALGYVPGGERNYEFTGGDRFSGRLSLQNGERGQVRIRLSTIGVTPPPLPVPVATPTPLPTPTVAPTATPTMTAAPTATPTPVPRPDLVITEFAVDHVTVSNQGAAPAGAFSVTVHPNRAALAFAGLAAGASENRPINPSLCNSNPRFLTAAADSSSQVIESNEANNASQQLDSVCIGR